MSLNKKTIQELRARGHKLKPVVLVGAKGLTANVLREIDLSLCHHQLLKVKIAASDRDHRRALADEICATLKATAVQQIGHQLLLFRADETPVLSTSEQAID